MRNLMNSRLSNKLFFAVMGTALLLGLILSAVQIVLDARQAHAQLQAEANQILLMLDRPATRALNQRDKLLADQVLESLFQNDAVFYAAISAPGEPPLATGFRNKKVIPFRSLIANLFGLEFSDTRQLKTATGEVAGSLEISLEPTHAAAAFVERCITQLISGITQAFAFALVLYLIIQGMITRPLKSLLASLTKIDPLRPAQRKLTPPRGHESDELGALTEKVNDLFDAVESYNFKRRLAEEHIERLSNYDILTELPNRSLLRQRIDRSLLSARFSNEKLAIIFCALDDFKSVNLLHSYHNGDKLLLTLADRWRTHLDADYTVARVGGDIFAFVVPGIRDTQEAAKAAREILEQVRRPFRIEHHLIHLSATAGITLFPDDGETTDLLLKQAETVTSLAKSLGGNGFQFYAADVDERLREDKALEKELLQAVARSQLGLVFQPQIDLVTGEIRGAEALVRWYHPQRGVIGPSEFIPLAERSTAIIHIGNWVLREACETLRSWLEAGFHHMTMSINVSANQLHQPELIRELGEILEQTGVPPQLLILEVTETAVMTNVDLAIQILRQIKRAGVQLAIDDFGTGYSSLNYLKDMPMDEIKVDQTFVRDMTNDADDANIVDAIIQLGHSLGLAVVAEGASSLEQVQQLQLRHCDFAQGYYFSQPVGCDAILDLLQQEHNGMVLKEQQSLLNIPET